MLTAKPPPLSVRRRPAFSRRRIDRGPSPLPIPVVAAIVAILGWARRFLFAWEAIAINTRRSLTVSSRQPAARFGTRAKRSGIFANAGHKPERCRREPVGAERAQHRGI